MSGLSVKNAKAYAWQASGGLAGTVFLDLRGLAVTLAQVVELGATHVALGDDLDVVDRGGVNREGTLNAHAEGNLADGERGGHTVTATSDHDTLEDLDTRAVTFDDLDVHLEGVAGSERGDVIAQRSRINGVQLLHFFSLTPLPQVGSAWLGGSSPLT